MPHVYLVPNKHRFAVVAANADTHGVPVLFGVALRPVNMVAPGLKFCDIRRDAFVHRISGLTDGTD